MTAADAARIFLQGDVADIMRAVFDAPMPAPPSQELLRAGQRSRRAGDRVLDFGGPLAVTIDRAGQMANLLQPGPIELAGQSRAGLELAAFPSTVPFAGRLGNVKLLRELSLIYRGKNPP